MVPVQLIEDLAAELKRILEHISFFNRKGSQTDINMFKYGLPVEKTKDDKDKKFPYILIAPNEGEVSESTEPQKISIQLLIGLFDEGLENQGKGMVLNVINDICERFLKNPVLKGNYYLEEKITWVLDREDEYPYHYGAIWLTFNIPAFRRESEYA